jgi:hypothetical protein
MTDRPFTFPAPEGSQIIETGSLTKSGELYQMIELDSRYLHDIMDLQAIIVRNLPRAEIFEPDSKQRVEQCFFKQGRILGILVDQTLIAYQILMFPGKNEYNLGYDLNFPDYELSKVFHMETSAVSPRYRGNSLALLLKRRAVRYAKDLGFHHMCGTISIYNYHSLKIHFTLGAMSKKIAIKYNDKMRHIFHRDLNTNLKMECDKPLFVKYDNIEGHRDAIGMGYNGCSLKGSSLDFDLVYLKPSRS